MWKQCLRKGILGAQLLTLGLGLGACAGRMASEDLTCALYGSWESEDEQLVFVLRPDGEESTLEKHDGSTVASYPIEWRVQDEQFQMRYAGSPSLKTIDPYAELAWRPTQPKRPEPLDCRVGRNGKELKLGPRYFYRLPEDGEW